MSANHPRPVRGGILSDLDEIDSGPARRKPYPNVAADSGTEVTHQATALVGAIVEWTDATIMLRDDSGRDHRFRNIAGSFLVGGRPVTLVRPTRPPAAALGVTASGSIAGPDQPARIARASRLLVEGVHDAELVEKVWGDDLRDEGIVVQPIDGADDLVEIVRALAPRPGRRLGVLLDHLIDGTKESRLAAQVRHPDVLIRGHKFVDIWAAIDPRLAGLTAWPDIPRTMSWKDGICQAVGENDSRRFWKKLVGRVTSYKDLDPSLVGSVEELIDFVTEPG